MQVITHPRRRWSPLAKSALSAVVAAGALTAGQARALVVFDPGFGSWEVTTFTGSYNDNIDKFNTPANGGVMPWHGNLALARQFAAAVGGDLGFPNACFERPTSYCPQDRQDGPYFFYSLYTNFIPNSDQIWHVQDTDTGGITETGIVRLSSVVTWAQATPAVPGPIPALGAAAAFGFSRKLRKRIKSSANTNSSSETI